jgi:DNA-binding MarR family transcriptional regulator
MKTAAKVLDRTNKKRACEERILSSLRQIIHGIDKYSRKLREDLKLTLPQLVCLLCIVEKGSVSASEISREVLISKSTLVGILDRLEEKKLIKRKRDKKDRRLVNIIASEEGIKIASEAPSPLQDRLADSLKKLSVKEQDSIALSLEKIAHLMKVQVLPETKIFEE